MNNEEKLEKSTAVGSLTLFVWLVIVSCG